MKEAMLWTQIGTVLAACIWGGLFVFALRETLGRIVRRACAVAQHAPGTFIVGLLAVCVSVYAAQKPTPDPDPDPDPEPGVTNQVTVVFDIGTLGVRTGGGALTQKIAYGTNAVEPRVKPKTGHSFLGWDEAYTNVMADLTVHALYETNRYAITYMNLKGMENPPENPASYTVYDTIQFAALSNATNWAFAGWSPACVNAGSTGDVVVVAQWVAIKPPTPDPDPDPDPEPEPEPSVRTFSRGVAIDPIVLDIETTGLKSVSVKGLPTGLKFMAKTYTIYGTPTKSGVFTATVTAKYASGTETSQMDFVVRGTGETLVTVAYDATCGKATGAGVYVPGKRITLKATAARGYVSTGWCMGEEILTRSASYALEVPKEDIALTATFIDSATDAASVSASVDGVALDVNKAFATNVYVGVPVVWPIDVSTLSAASVKVAGLPTGMKFTAKDIYVKGSKTEVQYPANAIYGAPSAASKNGTPSRVTVTVTTAGKAKRTFAMVILVDALPSTVAGTFTGGAQASSPCALTLTIAANGKASGKCTDLATGKSTTLAASTFTAYEPLQGAFTLALTAKGLWQGTLPARVTTNGVLDVFASAADFEAIEPLWETQWSNWKIEPWKTYAVTFAKKSFTYAVDEALAQTVTLSFANAGTVKATGVFVGKNARAYKASASTVACPLDLDCSTAVGSSYRIYVTFPAKAGTFDGYAEVIDLTWDGSAFVRKPELME